eukprot:CAMPEP_0181073260 /NCGR_PEP_ID=MMETSP1070-20121207/28989_1 /TAXON_ID=265543 /ORGANISM="Minutocellus polymorphus, Strain NH13" /LENGTH=662 /DNA_ID=CAMNT_0023154329 /DNA_START=1 /DNA_END=1986 /DNA_ORIENTATION=+
MSTFDLLCSAAENFCASTPFGPCIDAVPCTGGQNTADEAVLDEILERATDTHERNAPHGVTCDDLGNDETMAGNVNVTGSNNNESESNLRLESYNSLLTEDDHQSKSQQQHQQHRQSQLRGLENLGNTCYINSSLQVLMTLESFVDDVVSRTGNCGEITCGDSCGDSAGGDFGANPSNGTPPRKTEGNGPKNLTLLSEDVGSRGVFAEGRRRLPNRFPYSDSGEEEKKEERNSDYQQNYSEGDGNSPEKLHAALGNVFTNLRNASPNNDAANTSASSFPTLRRDQQDPAAAVNPRDFKQAIDSHAPQFVGFQQQDSHEFLGVLLDLLDEEVKARDQKAKASSNNGGKTQDNAEIAEGPQSAPPTVRSPQSPQKRKRSLSSSPSPSLVSEDEDSADGMPRTTSFADLTVKDISHLLYDGIDENDASRGEDKNEGVGGDDTDNSTDKKPASPVETHFVTEVRTTLQCNSCMFSRSKTEMYRCLSLDIDTSSESHSTNVKECLQRFFASEKRDVKCEKCFFDTATQTSEISKLPRALLLHFKRFIVDVAPDYSSVSYRKDARQVEFFDEVVADAEFDTDGSTSLAEHLATDCVLPSRAIAATTDGETPPITYKLQGIVNHIGKRADRGHYTAVTFTGTPKSGDRSLVYTKFNDERVIPISAKDAL